MLDAILAGLHALERTFMRLESRCAVGEFVLLMLAGCAALFYASFDALLPMFRGHVGMDTEAMRKALTNLVIALVIFAPGRWTVRRAVRKVMYPGEDRVVKRMALRLQFAAGAIAAAGGVRQLPFSMPVSLEASPSTVVCWISKTCW